MNLQSHQKVKLKAGSRMFPAEVTVEGQRIFFKFSFNKKLMAEIKMMDGSRWHGHDEYNPRKVWSVKHSERNLFQLQYLMHPGTDDPENPYRIYDQPLLDAHPYRDCLRKHQVEMFRHGFTRHYCEIAAEMGCISGSAKVQVNRAGKGFTCTLAELYTQFRSARASKPIFIRSLCRDSLRLNLVRNVLYKGRKMVFEMVLASGRRLTCTADHEIAVGPNEYKRLDNLSSGDQVLVNGKWTDKDGYIRVGCLKHKHPRWTTGGVYEHILVMEKVLGRYVRVDEVVHHKNEIKWDNRPENLELLPSSSEHGRQHGATNYRNMHNGDRVWFVPHYDTIVSISPAGIQEVYDVVCDDPHRNFVADGVIVHNCGKTLAAIEIMESSGSEDWFYVAPRSALVSVQLEFEKWRARLRPRFMTYEGLKKILAEWPSGKDAPLGVVYDEASRIKNPTAQRTVAARHLGEQIRQKWGPRGFVVEMSGSPAPKSPADWWSQVEVVRPGFLKEGNLDKFKNTLAIIEQRESFAGGGAYPHLVGWRDDARKCNVCGLPAEAETHADTVDVFQTTQYCHKYEPSVNEVERLYRRLRGLVLVVFKKDCLDLPDKIYREVILKPSRSVLNAAMAIQAKATSSISALTLMRELSDGFQYVESVQGTQDCPLCDGSKTTDERYDLRNPDEPLDQQEIMEGCRIVVHEDGTFSRGDPIEIAVRKVACWHCCGTGTIDRMLREAKQIPTPKEDALKDILEEHDEVGRLVVYAGFTGSVDRVASICRSQKWEIVRVDGRGWHTSLPYTKPEDMVKAFQDKSRKHGRIVFDGQPGAAGMGLTLTESPSIVYWSNDFNAESRIQSEDRIHRMGMDVNRGATIIDLLHLPADRLVLTNLKSKRRLQDMTMGEIKLVNEQALLG